MSDTNSNVNSNFNEFFSSLFQNVNINVLGCSPFASILSEKLYDCNKANLLYCEDPTAFLQAYQSIVASFLEEPQEDNSSNIVLNAFVLLKLIDINVSFKLDPKLLADLLVTLSNKLQLLETTYKNNQYGEYLRGFSVCYSINAKVQDILVCSSFEADRLKLKSFLLEAIAQAPVTNTILAGWNEFSLKYCGKRAAKKVTQVMKALFLYDHLVGEGLKNLLVNRAENQVAKKLRAFDDVGLQGVSQNILAFYSCKTGNEKRRFLSCGIENFIEYTEMINSLNRFLID